MIIYVLSNGKHVGYFVYKWDILICIYVLGFDGNAILYCGCFGMILKDALVLVLLTRLRNGVKTMMTLDAAKWNGTGGELSSCVINTSIRSCIKIFGTLSNKFTF